MHVPDYALFDQLDVLYRADPTAFEVKLWPTLINTRELVVWTRSVRQLERARAILPANIRLAVTLEDLRQLPSEHAPANLARVQAQRCISSPGSIQKLVMWLEHTRIEVLDLSSNPIVDDDIACLCAGHTLEHVHHLDLCDTATSVEAATSISRCAALQNLRSLIFSRGARGATIGADGAEALGASAYLRNLTTLNLFRHQIGPEGARALALSRNIRNLQHVFLSECALGDAGVEALCESTNLRAPLSLFLRNNNLTDASAYLLGQLPQTRFLTKLDLSLNDFTDHGASQIARSKHLTNLVSLNIEDNRITERGFLALSNTPNLESLVKLSVRGNLIATPPMNMYRDNLSSCPSCAEPIEPHYHFCEICGYPLGS